MLIFTANEHFEDRTIPFHIEKYTIGRGEEIVAHTHDFVELVYVAEGKAKHWLEDRAYELSPGDVFVIEPGACHSYEGSAEASTVVYNVLFSRELLGQELSALQKLPYFLDFFYLAPFFRKTSAFLPYAALAGRPRSELERHLETISFEYAAKLPGYALLIKTRLIECMVLLSRYAAGAARDARDAGPEPDRAWLDSITDLLERYCDQPFTLEQLSRISGMSVSSLTAKFKAAKGMTLTEYKHAVQVRKACGLLSGTKRTVLDIAGAVGLHDLAFFYKVFKRETGMTPVQYRRKSAEAGEK